MSWQLKEYVSQRALQDDPFKKQKNRRASLDPHRRLILQPSFTFYPVQLVVELPFLSCVCLLILDMAAGKESLWCVMEQPIISHSAPHTAERRRRRRKVEGENGERGLAVMF